MELLGDVGGLQQALYLIGLMLISYFTKRLFTSQLLRELYQTKFDRGDLSKKSDRKSPKTQIRQSQTVKIDQMQTIEPI